LQKLYPSHVALPDLPSQGRHMASYSASPLATPKFSAKKRKALNLSRFYAIAGQDRAVCDG
jgi:hypothetical protein